MTPSNVIRIEGGRHPMVEMNVDLLCVCLFCPDLFCEL
jgi:hypothetical protein